MTGCSSSLLGGCRWLANCKRVICFLLLYILGFLLLYAFGQLIFDRHDLTWMPPSPDLTFVTDSPRKKHPDGPLVLGDGILPEGSAADGGENKLAKAVLIEGAERNFDVRIREENEEKKGKRRSKLPISEQFLTKFRQAAKKIQQRRSAPNGFVLFSLINQAYGEMTQNWLCNIYALPSINEGSNSTGKGKKPAELLNAVLLVVLDEGKLCQEIRKSWPQVTCLSLFEKPAKNPTLQLDAEEQKAVNEPLSWGRLRYVQILTTRANLMAALSEVKVPFVLAESDAVWLRNPFIELFPKANLLEDADVVLPLNSAAGLATGHRFAFDPMVAFATEGTRRLMQEMRRVLNSQPDTMDQDLLNRLCSSQYAGVVCRHFSRNEIADGSWFKLSEAERARAAKQAGHWPFVVNNNFYVGVHNKMARQAINGLWFLSTKQKQCNQQKASRILQKYQKV